MILTTKLNEGDSMTQDVYKHFLATLALNSSLIHLELPQLEGVFKIYNFNIHNICACTKISSSTIIISDGAYTTKYAGI